MINYTNTSGNNARYDAIIDKSYDPENKIGACIKVDFKGKSLPEVFSTIQSLVKENIISYVYNPDFQKIRIVYDDCLIYAQVSEKENNLINIYINAPFNRIDSYLDYFISIKADQLKFIDWCYKSEGRLETSTIKLKNVEKISNNAYPWFNNDPIAYFKKYLDSNSANLLLLGPPGTGKSSFIAYMIREFGLETLITYDRELLDSDQLYSKFISSKYNLLLIEDADTMLLSREKDNNNMLHKLLNTSDGIVDTSGKKIIFTANIENKSRIDSALIRPGRCFDIVDFRHLTYKESCVVADELGIDLKKEKEYTISEIYNGTGKQIQKMGFL